MKVAILSNSTSDIVKARGDLIKSIIELGHEVIAIGNENINIKKIQRLGAKPINIKNNSISISFIKNIRYIIELIKVLKNEKVDILLGYSVKPIVLGSIAGKIAKVKEIYALVVGMGYNYSINTFRTIIVRFFCNIGYKIAFKIDKKVIFQNKEDKEELINKKFVKPEKAVLIDGSGVNLKKYIKTENKIENMDKLKFLMISRGLKIKGIRELAKAAEIIHKEYPNCKFIHIGEIEKSYRGLSKKEIKEYSQNIEFKGKVDNVYEYLKEANVVVLPTYLREGIPRGLLEALAVGRPIITTNLRGCRETVIDGVNGYLVKERDEQDLKDKIELMINSTPEIIREMSEKSYEIAKDRFDVRIINKKMLEYMNLD